jgi:general secretion pathway protein G
MFSHAISHMDVIRQCPGPRRRRGFTLLEFMCAAAVAALLLTIAVPTYRASIQRAHVRACVDDLLQLSMAIESYRTMHGMHPPLSLDDLPPGPRTDPWGNPYKFLNFDSGVPGVKGMIRKDHNLHPLNSEFDLYSTGPDGKSAAALTAKPSRDDIIWARDGSYVGVASEY